jgi:hypothetical protein
LGFAIGVALPRHYPDEPDEIALTFHPMDRSIVMI